MDTLITAARTPFFCTDITYYHDLLLSDFSPIEDIPDVFTDTEEEVYIKNGFLASNASDTAGIIYVITWEEFQIHRTQSNRLLVTNLQVLDLCAGIAIYLTSGAWTMTPLVKVFMIEGEEPVFLPKVGIGPDWPEWPDWVGTVPIEYINIGTIR
jgi:hypothetical protein